MKSKNYTTDEIAEALWNEVLNARPDADCGWTTGLLHHREWREIQSGYNGDEGQQPADWVREIVTFVRERA